MIDPGQAFGTGAHATTRLCLELMLDSAGAAVRSSTSAAGRACSRSPPRGSAGIPVVALDYDPASVEATVDNARVNGVAISVARHDLRVDPVATGRDGGGEPAAAAAAGVGRAAGASAAVASGDRDRQRPARRRGRRGRRRVRARSGLRRGARGASPASGRRCCSSAGGPAKPDIRRRRARPCQISHAPHARRVTVSLVVLDCQSDAMFSLHPGRATVDNRPASDLVHRADAAEPPPAASLTSTCDPGTDAEKEVNPVAQPARDRRDARWPAPRRGRAAAKASGWICA